MIIDKPGFRLDNYVVSYAPLIIHSMSANYGCDFWYCYYSQEAASNLMNSIPLINYLKSLLPE